MNVSKQSLWFLLILIVITGSAWHFTKTKVIDSLAMKTLSSQVDSSVLNLRVKQFNKEGVLVNSLTTPLMKHIPKGDVNILQQPHIMVVQNDQPAWEIHAQKAKAFEGGKRIVFTKQVVVYQNAGDNNQESTLKTEEITYYPKEKKALSSLLVTFEQPGNVIQSRGMTAYLEEKRIELLHQARGTYVPAKG